MTERREFVEDARRQLYTMRELCARYGVSPPRGLAGSSPRCAWRRVGAIALAQPRWLARWLAARVPDVAFEGASTRGALALTIDDSPSARTARLLDVLRAHRARATFFVLGSQVRARRAVLARAVREGHELGNHLWDETPSVRYPPREFERLLLRTHRALAALGPGSPP